MSTITWSPALELGDARMDATHREFAAAVNAVTDAADADLLERLDDLIAHTADHFGQENRWMEMLPFPPIHCHVGEHDGVIDIMREARQYVAEGKHEVGRVLARELGPWFENHARSMDAVLAYVIRETGFDTANPAPVTGPGPLGDRSCASVTAGGACDLHEVPGEAATTATAAAVR
jgi:hemerythrin-like metal-binding protein